MPHCWVGSGEDYWEDLYEDVCDAEDDAERKGVLQPPWAIIEIGRYTRNRIPRGVALYCIVQRHFVDEGRGWFAEAYGLAHTADAKHSAHAKHCGKIGDATCMSRAMLHFCQAPCGRCCTHLEGHELLHVYVYRDICKDESVDEAGWPWLNGWIPGIDQKMEAICKETLPHWRELVDEYYFSLSLRCYEGEEVAARPKEAKRDRRLQRKRMADDTQFVQNEQRRELQLLRCLCGRPPANEADGVVWCLLCPPPAAAPPHRELFNPPKELLGRKNRDALFDAYNNDIPLRLRAIHDDPLRQKALEQSRPANLTDIVGWKLCELTRARIRRHGGVSLEYFNMLLYLKRVGQDWWLAKFHDLDEWLQQSPRTFESLPTYPQKRSKVSKERVLAQWVSQQSRSLSRSYGNAREEAQNHLLRSLDGWSAWIHDAGERDAAFDMSHTGRSPNVWAVKFEELEAWVLSNDMLPKRSSEDSRERALGEWLKYNRARRKRKKLHDDRALVLGAVDAEKGPDFVWNSSLEAADQWFASHNRKPKLSADGDMERKIAKWIENQRSRLKSKSLSENQLRKLADAKWWNPEDPWMRSFAVTDSWCVLHPGKRPSLKSSEDCERRAAGWIMNNIAALRQGRLTSKQKKCVRAASWWPPRKVLQKSTKAMKTTKSMKVMKTKRR